MLFSLDSFRRAMSTLLLRFTIAVALLLAVLAPGVALPGAEAAATAAERPALPVTTEPSESPSPTTAAPPTTKRRCEVLGTCPVRPPGGGVLDPGTNPTTGTTLPPGTPTTRGAGTATTTGPGSATTARGAGTTARGGGSPSGVGTSGSDGSTSTAPTSETVVDASSEETSGDGFPVLLVIIIVVLAGGGGAAAFILRRRAREA